MATVRNLADSSAYSELSVATVRTIADDNKLLIGTLSNI